MNHSDKYVSRPGNFIMVAGQDTNTLNANVLGALGTSWAIEVIEAATFSTLQDAGADALSNGTSGTNNGVNFSNSFSVPAGALLIASTERGFTRIAISAGTILVHRLANLQA